MPCELGAEDVKHLFVQKEAFDGIKDHRPLQRTRRKPDTPSALRK